MQNNLEEEDLDPNCLRRHLKRVRRLSQTWAASLPFNIFFTLVIVTNSLFLGLQLELSANTLNAEQHARHCIGVA